MLHAGNIGSYAAGSISGYNNPTTSASANTIVYRDGSGHISGVYGFFNYLNMSHGVSGSTTDSIFYSSGDDYIRKNNATGFRASLNVPTRTGGDASGTWGINVTGNAATASAMGYFSSNGGQDFLGRGKRCIVATTAEMVLNYGNDFTSVSIQSALSTSGTLRVYGNDMYMQGGSPTIHFVDSDERGCALHNNSNLLYILSSNGTGGESWSQNNGYWPFYINLNSNDATFGGSIWAAGNITAYSDLKLKENIVQVENALDKVLELRGVYYNTKLDPNKTKRIGVIAQEIQKVLPEVVTLHSDPEDTEGTLGVDYGNITALLIEAMKEQQATIESLKERILVLENIKK
jgi:hypothetical protein